MTVLVQLLLEWNNLLFNFDIVNFVGKSDEGNAQSSVLLIFVLWQCFNRRWVRGCQLGQKVLLWGSLIFPAGI